MHGYYSPTNFIGLFTAPSGEYVIMGITSLIPIAKFLSRSCRISSRFVIVHPKEFSARFIDWMAASLSLPAKDVVSVDGKTSRDSGDKDQKALHIVSALCHSYGLIVGQTKTEEKSNKITAIPELLKQLMIKDCIVTIDAMGAQKKIAEQIVNKNEADYLFNLKGYQETLHKEVKTYFADLEQSGELPSLEKSSVESKIGVHRTLDKGHVRIERRTILHMIDSNDFLF
jgi:predicted transposase YbfD/YdcC